MHMHIFKTEAYEGLFYFCYVFLGHLFMLRNRAISWIVKTHIMEIAKMDGSFYKFVNG